MTKLHTIQSLKVRLNARPQTLQDLVAVFEDYKRTVTSFISEGAPYSAALRHTHEEYPDLQRLIGKGHDAVLKGRLADALSTLRKKVEEIEKATLPDAPDNNTEAPAADTQEGNDADGKPKWRSTPTLGMD